MPPPEGCASCGTPAEAGQEYCLRCGTRITPARRLSTFGYAWERRLGRYPGDWVFASLLLLLVAAGSATAGIVAGRDTGAASAARTVVATSPVVPAPPAPPAPTEPTTTAAAPRPTPRPTPKANPGPAAWPARNGYTVVIASIPARGTGLADATAKAKEALGRGISGAGVLDSGKFASLHPGYYVVFAGVYASLDQAQSAARSIASKYPNAYARQVTR
jgi:cell division septation protein DedD